MKVCQNPEDCCRALSRSWSALGDDRSMRPIDERIVELRRRAEDAESARVKMRLRLDDTLAAFYVLFGATMSFNEQNKSLLCLICQCHNQHDDHCPLLEMQTVLHRRE